MSQYLLIIQDIYLNKTNFIIISSFSFKGKGTTIIIKTSLSEFNAWT